MAHCVGDEILHGTRERRRVAFDERQSAIDVRFHHHALLFGHPTARSNRLVDHDVDVDGRVRQLAARLHAAVRKHLADHLGQTPRLLHDRCTVSRHLRLLGDDSVGEILAGCGERSDRCVQLVRDTGNELELLQSQTFGTAQHRHEREHCAGENGEDSAGEHQVAAPRRADNFFERATNAAAE